MADDLDFVWQPPRPAPPGRPSSPRPTPQPDQPVRWVMLRDASDRTGVAVSTIRNWARKGRVPTMLADAAEGPRRMVGLDEVLARASQLGRQHDAPAAPQPAAGDGPVPEGHLLVPLDAWEKMLLQLGNLHTAGQDLASARERAAKAETEAGFLRERVAELREERDQLRQGTAETVTAVATEPPEAVPAPPQPWYRHIATRLRRRG